MNAYRAFRRKPRDLSLGISLLIKDRTASLLRGESCLSSSMKKDSEKPHHSPIRKTVLCACNKFPHEIGRTLIGYELHVDLSKRVKTDKLNGFFNETGVIGMLENRVFDKIVVVSSFIGTILDRLCELENVPITLSHTYYMISIHAIYRHGRRHGWTRE